MNESPQTVIQMLSAHPKSDALCGRIAAVCLGAAEQRAPEVLSGSAVSQLPEGPVLSREDAATPLGNALEILDRGASSSKEWTLLAAAVALVSAQKYDGNSEASLLCLQHCTLLARETPCNPFLFFDAALQPSQASFWSFVDVHFRSLAAADQALLAASLIASSSAPCLLVKQRWLEAATHPTLLALLQTGATQAPLLGVLQPNRAHPLLVLLQALSGYLLLRSAFRFLRRWVLGVKREGELRLSASGLSLRQKTSMLGIAVRETETLVPLEQLVSVSVEEHWLELRSVLGVLFLGLGSYLGSQLFWDALRAPGLSPTWLGYGLLLLLAGLVLDFGLTALGRRGGSRVRLRVDRRSAKSITLGRVAREPSVSLLRALEHQFGFRAGVAAAAFGNTALSASPPANSAPEKSAPEKSEARPTSDSPRDASVALESAPLPSAGAQLDPK